jgi:hypothetical protein
MEPAMTPDSLFQIANMIALAGWLALLASPFAFRLSEIVAGLAIPLLLSAGYTGLVLAFWSGARGGFDSLANVELLFKSREIVLAGWLHYLAFDLFIGTWEARTARSERIPFVLVLPCLVLTFLFGPVGFLLFNAIRLGRRIFTIPATA